MDLFIKLNLNSTVPTIQTKLIVAVTATQDLLTSLPLNPGSPGLPGNPVLPFSPLEPSFP